MVTQGVPEESTLKYASCHRQMHERRNDNSRSSIAWAERQCGEDARSHPLKISRVLPNL
jgi:hypothetical protein